MCPATPLTKAMALIPSWPLRGFRLEIRQVSPLIVLYKRVP
jgi:hypothetical protein